MTIDKDDLEGTNRPIRLGIMCSGTTFPEWQARALQYLLALDYVKVQLLIIDSNVDKRPLLGRIKRLLARSGCGIYSLYQQFVFRPRTSRQVDMSNVLSQVPSIECKVIEEGKFPQYFTEADCAKIAEYGLDVVLRFAFGIIRGKILKVPRYGVWSFHHDDEEKYRGGPPCFWEIYYGDDATGGILQRLTDRLDGGIVLKKGFVATCKYSYSENMERLYCESAKWPAQVCKDIYNGNAGYLNALPSKTNAPIYYAPNNCQMLVFAVKILRNRVSATWHERFYAAQWNIGVICEPIDTLLQSEADYCQIHWAPTPRTNRFLADPFGQTDGSNITILCEDFDYRRNKGIISSIVFDGERKFSEAKPVMNEAFHMSYPYLLLHQGKVYCIPETSDARETYLYRADQFPNKWRKIATLLSGVAVADPTVFQYEGLWWLMCSGSDLEQGSPGSFNNHLLIWYAEDLTGPWKSHISNPVKTDIRSSRPAGTPFLYKGYLYRPAQDCSKTYGGRVSLNRVLRLTPREFTEEFVRYIEPPKDSPFPAGLHTISSAGIFTLIDGHRFVFSPKRALRLLLHFNR